MIINQLKERADEQILSEIFDVRVTERDATAKIVLYLAEIDRRGIYREAGYSSLFTYCTEHLNYSEAGAARRVKAVRCYHNNPEVYELLRDGKISLSALCEIAPVITPENKEVVLTQAAGSSRRAAQLVAAAHGAVTKPKKAVIRAKKVVVEELPLLNFEKKAEPKVEECFGFSFDVSPRVKALYDEARAFIGHCGPAEVLERALEEFVEKRKKGSKPVSRKPVAKSAVKSEAPRSRSIPVSVQREVRRRDECRCTYESADGKRCSERVGLQFDHIVPFAKGGEHTLENLRLRCFAHNQLYAEQCFGVSFRKLRQAELSEKFGVRQRQSS